MEGLKLEVEAERTGLKGSVLGACKRWGEQISRNRELNKLFRKPECENYDQLVDELAEQYWNGYLDEDSREQHKNGLRNSALRDGNEGSDIVIHGELIKERYPYICAHIKCAKEVGLVTGIPYQRRGMITARTGFDPYYDVVVIPIKGKLDEIKEKTEA